MSESSPSFGEDQSNQESTEAAFDEFVPFDKARERWEELKTAVPQEYAKSGSVSETTLYAMLEGNTLMEIGARQYYSQFPDAAAALGFTGPENEQKVKELQQMTRDATTYTPTPALQERYQLFITNARSELQAAEAKGSIDPERLKELRTEVEAYEYGNRYFVTEDTSEDSHT